MSGHQEPIDRPVPDILPILPLRAAVVFPHAMSPLAAGRASSKRLIEDAAKQSRLIAVVMQRDPSEEEPGASGLHPIGTLAMIHRVLKQPDGTLRLIVQGVGRLRVVEVVETTPYLRARVEFLSDVPAAEQDVEAEALVRSATALFEKVVALSPALPDELANVVTTAEGLSALADVIAASMPTLALPVKQLLLETFDVKARLQALVTALGKEAEVLELGSKIQSEIQSEMSKTQREYYLREQLKAIQKELGEGDERTQEIDGLREKIEQAGMTEEARKEALRELERLAKMPPAAAEYTVARTYLAGRHARRGGDPWSSADVHRRAPRSDRAGTAARGQPEPRFHAGRGGQAGYRFPGRSGVGAPRGPRPRAERDLPRSLPRRGLRPVASPVHHDGQRHRCRPAAPPRPDGGDPSRWLHGGGEGPHRAPASGAAPGPRARAGRRRRGELHPRGRAPPRSWLHAGGWCAQSRAGDRQHLPEGGPPQGRGRSPGGDDHAGLGDVVPRRPALRVRGAGGAHADARRGGRPRVDSRRRRSALH